MPIFYGPPNPQQRRPFIFGISSGVDSCLVAALRILRQQQTLYSTWIEERTEMRTGWPQVMTTAMDTPPPDPSFSTKDMIGHHTPVPWPR